MKKSFAILMVMLFAGLVGCNNDDARYIDLNTGKTIKLEKDESGRMVDAETKNPVRIYVDTKTKDTIYGKTGKVINGHVVRRNDDTWAYDADISSDGGDDGDYKIKVENDGDVKIKDGDTKTKIDGETGEKKVKKDD